MKEPKFNFKVGDKVKGFCLFYEYGESEHRAYFQGVIKQDFDDGSYEVDMVGRCPGYLVELYNDDFMQHGQFTRLEKILYNVVDTED